MSKDKIRILFVLSEFMYGSKVRQLCDLVNGLDKNIFDIEVCALELGNEATGEIAALGVPFYQLRLYPPRSLDIAKIIQFLKSPAGLRRKNYDIVHSLLYQSIFIEPLIIRLFSHAKYIYTKTNLEWNNHRFNWNIKSRLADKIVSISSATDELISNHGFAGKVARIYNGVDTRVFQYDVELKNAFRKSFNIKSTEFVFGCAAQFIEVKNHPILISAFNLLAKRYNIRLLLCGTRYEDEYSRKIIHLVKDAGEKVVDIGVTDDMPSFYSAIDCFVLPSKSEGLPYVFIEAMSTGRPTISTGIKGIRDIVDEGYTGDFVKESCVEDLAKKMENLYLDLDRQKEYSKNARTKILKVFSKEAMVQNHGELYQSLL